MAPPKIVKFEPTNNINLVAPGSAVKFTFNKKIYKSDGPYAGNLKFSLAQLVPGEICKGDEVAKCADFHHTGAVTTTSHLLDSPRVIIKDTELRLDMAHLTGGNLVYSVGLPMDFVTDASNNSFPGLPAWQYRFRTAHAPPVEEEEVPYEQDQQAAVWLGLISALCTLAMAILMCLRPVRPHSHLTVDPAYRSSLQGNGSFGAAGTAGYGGPGAVAYGAPPGGAIVNPNSLASANGVPGAAGVNGPPLLPLRDPYRPSGPNDALAMKIAAAIFDDRPARPGSFRAGNLPTQVPGSTRSSLPSLRSPPVAVGRNSLASVSGADGSLSTLERATASCPAAQPGTEAWRSGATGNSVRAVRIRELEDRISFLTVQQRQIDVESRAIAFVARSSPKAKGAPAPKRASLPPGSVQAPGSTASSSSSPVAARPQSVAEQSLQVAMAQQELRVRMAEQCAESSALQARLAEQPHALRAASAPDLTPHADTGDRLDALLGIRSIADTQVLSAGCQAAAPRASPEAPLVLPSAIGEPSLPSAVGLSSSPSTVLPSVIGEPSLPSAVGEPSLPSTVPEPS